MLLPAYGSGYCRTQYKPQTKDALKEQTRSLYENETGLLLGRVAFLRDLNFKLVAALIRRHRTIQGGTTPHLKSN